MIIKLYQRIAMTGIGIIGVGLAIVLSQLGFNFGTGSGTGEGQATTESTSLDQTMSTIDSPAVPTPPQKKTEEETENAKPDTSKVISIIVVASGYQWATNTTSPKPVESITLDEIIEKAKQTEGNAQGVRARIFHAGSALPSAETELIKALKQAGLTELEIDFDQRIIDIE